MKRIIDHGLPCKSYFLLCSVFMFVITCASPLRAADMGGEQDTASVVLTSPAELPVAVVNKQPIKKTVLDAHMAATHLSREEALEDLIDLTLIRTSAAENGIKVPEGIWSTEERARVELALANALSLEIAVPRVLLVVDHAWLKDSEDEESQATGRAQMEQLRASVEAGATIPAAYAKLQIDGNAWHIGDHEEYPYDTVPEEARDLLLSTLSPIIPGDGGLHLFVIHQRKQILPTSEDIRGPLRERLRDEAMIERPEQENQ